MPALEKEIAAFESSQQQLERDHLGKWVVIHEQEVVGIFDNFDAAASDAVRKFGHGPYLIRQIGAPPMVMPASAMYVFDGAR
jgi:hypothetical protein